MATPDVTSIANYAGEYKKELIAQIYSSMNLENEGILVVPGIKNKLNLHKLIVEDGVKPYTGNFVADDDDLSYEPRVLEVLPAQRDLLIEPKKYLTTFMAEMRGRGENAGNMTIPFEQFTWEQVMKALGQEINTGTVYHGVGKAGFAAYDAGTAYNVGDKITFVQNGETRYFRCIEATAAGQNPDTHKAKWKKAGAMAIAKGFGKIIADEVAGGNITPVATGPITAADAYAQNLQVFRSHKEEVKNGVYGPVVQLMSVTSYEHLVDDYEGKVSKNFETINGITYLAKTERKCIIKPVSWLSSSGRIISTLGNNLLAGTDDLNDANSIETFKIPYKIQAAIAFVLGFQISDLDGLRTNDQA